YYVVNANPFGSFSYADAMKFVMPAPGNMFCAGHTHLADGRLLITGGQAEALKGNGSDVSFIYDPMTKRSSGAASPAQPHHYPSVTMLADNAVLVLGGSKYTYAIMHGGTASDGSTGADMHSLTMGATRRWLSAAEENLVVNAAPGCEAAPPAL